MAVIRFTDWQPVDTTYPGAAWAERELPRKRGEKRLFEVARISPDEIRAEVQCSVHWAGEAVGGVRIGPVAGRNDSFYCNLHSSSLIREDPDGLLSRAIGGYLIPTPNAPRNRMVPEFPKGGFATRPVEDRWARLVAAACRQEPLHSALMAFFAGGAELSEVELDIEPPAEDRPSADKRFTDDEVKKLAQRHHVYETQQKIRYGD